MVLELVYSEAERVRARNTARQIYEIKYKELISPEQLESQNPELLDAPSTTEEDSEDEESDPREEEVGDSGAGPSWAGNEEEVGLETPLESVE